jgi:RNA polymerase sigma factor (sigma-70 family)
MTRESLPPDEELIERLRSGDERVIEMLVAAYWSALCNYAEGLLDGATDPQDVAQEAFVRLWSRRKKWRREGSVRALLYTVTRNAAFDERRRGVRADSASRAAPTPAPSPTPADEAVADDLRVAAEAAVSCLPPMRQEIFRLAREEGLTYGEIASVLDLSPQTVANHMSLALSDLRRDLAEHLTEGARRG